MGTKLFLDTETIPTQREDLIAELRSQVDAELAEAVQSVKAPSNYKDETKIAEYVAAKKAELAAEFEPKFDERYRATSLDGAFGELFCIGSAIDDEDSGVLYREDLTREAERDLLMRFYRSVSSSVSGRVQIIGHNVVGFDLRFLWQRSMVLGVAPPAWLPMDPKPWDDIVFDTMVRWAGVRDRVKLSKLCKAFGIEDTDTIDGSMVWDHVRQGYGSVVVRHCMLDVEKTRRIYKRMSFTS